MPQLQNYTFDDKIIARGFTSVVYKGQNIHTKQKFAIKCIDQSILDDPSKKKMLTNQLNIQWQLQSQPFIVEIKGQYYQNDSIYIVTEFCEFGDLKSKIKQKGKFVQPKAVSYMLDIIKGFQNLVRHKIVHRDLKPSNIMISKKGIKIGDFGFAYKIQQHKKVQQTNIPSAGSPLYQAPQVLQDGKNSSHLSDIWSLGVVFYEMVTGRLPFPAKNKEALVKLIDRIGIRTIIPQNLSLKSKQFILRTLKKDPTKRMTSEELIAFEFDDEILFKIKQHRQRKKQQQRKRIQEGKYEKSSEQKIKQEQKARLKTKEQSIRKNQANNKNENLNENKKKYNPEIQKGQSIKKNDNEEIKSIKKDRNPIQNNSGISNKNGLNNNLLKKEQKMILNVPPQLNKNKQMFQFFDNNRHSGRSLLDPADIHVKRHKKIKQKEENGQIDQHHGQVKAGNKQIEIKLEEDRRNDKKQRLIQEKQKKYNKDMIKQPNRQVNLQNKNRNYQQISQHKHIKNHQQIQMNPIYQKHHQNNHKEHTNKIQSIVSSEYQIEQNDKLKKEQIIQIILNQIDIIRFLSRITHKIQQIHHIHIPQRHHHGHHDKREQDRHSSQSKQSHERSQIKRQPPLIYVQLKQLIYKTIIQIQKLQFMPPDQAYKFYRSQQFDQIKLILDTYKTKLQLVSVNPSQWKGLKRFQHQLQKEILLIYKSTKEKIKFISNICMNHNQTTHANNLDSIRKDNEQIQHKQINQQREFKKLGRKLQALNYLIVLRYDYLIVQRQEILINENLVNKSNKYQQQRQHIKLIIQQKHSKNHQIVKSFQQLIKDLSRIQNKMKSIKLI